MLEIIGLYFYENLSHWMSKNQEISIILFSLFVPMIPIKSCSQIWKPEWGYYSYSVINVLATQSELERCPMYFYSFLFCMRCRLLTIHNAPLNGTKNKVIVNILHLGLTFVLYRVLHSLIVTPSSSSLFLVNFLFDMKLKIRSNMLFMPTMMPF